MGAARDVRVHELTLPVHGTHEARVALYTHVTASAGADVPLLAIAPPPPAEAAADDALLHELWASLAGRAAGGGQTALFRLFDDPSCDHWADPASFEPGQLERLGDLVRRRIFDVWRALNPALARLSGSFEMFNPAHGANMGWHQDGHSGGEFVAHYYLGSGEGDQPSTEGMPGLGHPLDEATGWLRGPVGRVDYAPQAWRHAPERTCASTGVWRGEGVGKQWRVSAHRAAPRWPHRFEVVIPPVAEAGADASEEGAEEGAYTVDLSSAEALRGGVATSGFVAFDLGARTASQRLVLFEDAAVLHRTPLTAHARPDLQARRQRPIARIVCYGASADGATLGVGAPPQPPPPPPPPLPPSEARAALVGAAVEVELPAGLCRALDSLAAQRQGADSSDSGWGGGCARAAALDAYVQGEREVVSFLARAPLAGTANSADTDSKTASNGIVTRLKRTT